MDHFSEGFMALSPSGMTVQMRKYIRDDGKTIQLFPMAHVGDASFYQKLSHAFPSNSIICMEGVTDEHHLLTNHISYKRMAKTLGLTEQAKAFEPVHGKIVMADVDVSVFSKKTLATLNLIMFFHAQGINAATLRSITADSFSPELLDELMDDLVRKRNEHLLEQIRARLPETEHIIVPWGAAHIPEISRAIQKAGFRLDETQNFTIINFHPNKNQNVTGTNSSAEKVK